MTPFNPELASQGRPVITRDGEWRMIDHYLFEKHNSVIKLYALLEHIKTKEKTVTGYSKEGTIWGSKESSFDLFMEESPAEKDVWVNLYWQGGKSYSVEYPDKETAEYWAKPENKQGRRILLSTTHYKVPIK